jgi:hypothetical protein
MLRVSRYLHEFDIETRDGSVRIPAHHVRISIWSDDRALCAVSISDDEAHDLLSFLAAVVAREADGDHASAPSPG